MPPKTSLLAHDVAKKRLKSEHKQKILVVLSKLNEAGYERIADMACLDKHQVARRLSELVKDNLIFVVEGRFETTISGRSAAVYSLIKNKQQHEPNGTTGALQLLMF